jgi:hypothetical protein
MYARRERRQAYSFNNYSPSLARNDYDFRFSALVLFTSYSYPSPRLSRGGCHWFLSWIQLPTFDSDDSCGRQGTDPLDFTIYTFVLLSWVVVTLLGHITLLVPGSKVFTSDKGYLQRIGGDNLISHHSVIPISLLPNSLNSNEHGVDSELECHWSDGSNPLRILSSWFAAYAMFLSVWGSTPMYTTSLTLSDELKRELACGMRLSHNTNAPAPQGTCVKLWMMSASSSGRMGVYSPTHTGGSAAPDLVSTVPGRVEAHASNRLCRPGQHSNPPQSLSSVAVSETNAWIGFHFFLWIESVYKACGQQSRCGARPRCNGRFLVPYCFDRLSGSRKQMRSI